MKVDWPWLIVVGVFAATVPTRAAEDQRSGAPEQIPESEIIILSKPEADAVKAEFTRMRDEIRKLKESNTTCWRQFQVTL